MFISYKRLSQFVLLATAGILALSACGGSTSAAAFELVADWEAGTFTATSDISMCSDGETASVARASGWWSGAGSNRRPPVFQIDTARQAYSANRSAALTHHRFPPCTVSHRIALVRVVSRTKCRPNYGGSGRTYCRIWAAEWNGEGQRRSPTDVDRWNSCSSSASSQISVCGRSFLSQRRTAARRHTLLRTRVSGSPLVPQALDPPASCNHQ